MSAGQQAAPGPSHWKVEPHHARMQARGHASVRARQREDRENSLGLIIATSLFFVLFAAAVLLGGHAIIAPLLHRAAAARAMNSTGDIVYTMPDGVFCRHLLFDNATGDISEGVIEECPDSNSRAHSDLSEFRWGSSR